MNPSRLFKTTAIRLALRYALFYAILNILGLGALYWATSHYVDAQIAVSLKQELAKLIEVDQAHGRAQLMNVLNGKPALGMENQRYYLLIGPNGEKLAGNLSGWPEGLSTHRQVQNIWIDDTLIPGDIEDDDGFWPVVADVLSDNARILVAQGVHQAEDLHEFIISAIAAVITLSITLALAMAWRLGRTILRRIDSINQTAADIMAGDFSQRIPMTGRADEFDALATSLNSMLARIEQLMQGMRQVTDNVAHDLRRPLSRLRNRLEVTLLNARNETQYRTTLQEAITDANGLIRSFNALLEIAQTEAGSSRGDRQALDLSTLSHEVGELYRDLADEQGKQLSIDITPGLRVNGNRQLLAQAISNLLDNAIKYSGQAALLGLRARLDAGYPCITVSDNGPGIPEREHEAVLRRFYRLDDARSNEGNGLGLSLVKAVCDLHKAELVLENLHPGLGVSMRFTVKSDQASH